MNLDVLITIALFAMLVATAVAIARMTSLFAVIMLSGVFSLLSALLFVLMDAADVAFTEAAVGAGITTVLMLGTMALAASREKMVVNRSPFALFVVVVTGAVLIYGTLDMPNFGSPDTPSQTHLAREFLERAPVDTGVPNVVTAILASYRGYDTLGEVVVVFTAAIGVLFLLSSLGRRGRGRSDRRRGSN